MQYGRVIGPLEGHKPAEPIRGPPFISSHSSTRVQAKQRNRTRQIAFRSKQPGGGHAIAALQLFTTYYRTCFGAYADPHCISSSTAIHCIYIHEKALQNANFPATAPHFIVSLDSTTNYQSPQKNNNFQVTQPVHVSAGPRKHVTCAKTD